MYYNSVGTLKKILLYDSRNANNGSDKVEGNNNNLSSTSTFCSINRIPTSILHTANGEEYYHLEIICNDDTEYLIQAYGEEAKALNREVDKFDSSSNDVPREKEKFVIKENEEEQQKDKFASVRSEIDYIINFSFDNKNGYSLVFKKFKDVCISKKRQIRTEFNTFS